MPNVHVPETIAREIAGYRIQELPRRQAPSTVMMLSKPGRRPMVLEIGRDLVAEARRLRWLEGHRRRPPKVAALIKRGGEGIVNIPISAFDTLNFTEAGIIESDIALRKPSWRQPVA